MIDSKIYLCPVYVAFLHCLQLLLEAPEDILAFEFCPSDPNIIAGGCINGQVLTLTDLHVSAIRNKQSIR